MTRFFPLITLLLACTLGYGCTSGLTQDAEVLEKRYFVLQVERPGAPHASPSPGVCKVKDVTISPSFSSREMVYRLSHSSFSTDYYNQYHSSPDDLISQTMRHWIDEARLFEYVTDPSSEVRPQYYLEGHVVSLYGDFSTPGNPAAVLKMQFFLLKDEDFDFAIRMDKDYERSIPLAEKSAEGVVDGLNAALADILAELEADLAAHLP
ncbi:MAG: hypothetical protein D6E12_04100 [Desulfovibrio sp.]|nr:MAG: hypothetical protein D6E12_04100 [Desulfovibrio sp.]